MIFIRYPTERKHWAITQRKLCWAHFFCQFSKRDHHKGLQVKHQIAQKETIQKNAYTNSINIEEEHSKMELHTNDFDDVTRYLI